MTGRRTTGLATTAVRSTAVTAASLLLLAGCSSAGPKASPSASGSPTPAASALPRPSGQAPSSTTSPAASRSSADYSDPKVVAMAFVVAYVQRGFRDATPQAYLTRLRPFATDELVQKLRSVTSDHCDLACQQSQQRQLVVSADHVTASVSQEAPHSQDETWVQVSCRESTSWQGGGDSVPYGVSVKLNRTGGRWLVSAMEDAG